MGELTWIVDQTTGELIVEGLAPSDAPALVGDLLPAAVVMGCSRPLGLLPPPVSRRTAVWLPIRISGYYHNSLVEGPGRRSVVRMQGCPIHCPGCWVPETWDPNGGKDVEIATLTKKLLDPAYERDGVTILGGEPFAQPYHLWWLVLQLMHCGCPHLVVYSGYTYEQLMKVPIHSVKAVLEAIDVLIDGPYVAKLAAGAGPWTGSSNQRVIDMAATRAAGKVVLWET